MLRPSYLALDWGLHAGVEEMVLVFFEKEKKKAMKKAMKKKKKKKKKSEHAYYDLHLLL